MPIACHSSVAAGAAEGITVPLSSKLGPSANFAGACCRSRQHGRRPHRDGDRSGSIVAGCAVSEVEVGFVVPHGGVGGFVLADVIASRLDQPWGANDFHGKESCGLIVDTGMPLHRPAGFTEAQMKSWRPALR